ncbi:MAG: formylglycine-generating enzyme family protein [Planctomycetota bacterium]
MELCWIPGGTFWMGSSDGRLNEQPPHRVSIHANPGVLSEAGFWMGRFPVTQRQYAAIVPGHKNHFQANDDDPASWNRPAEQISWHDAMAFVQQLNASPTVKLPAGCILSLPSEAEWEYACRAGTRTDFYTGDDESALRSCAWYGVNWNTGSTHPVGQLFANAWGLHDMHGNVREWCLDAWDTNAYRHRVGNAVDPLNPGSSETLRTHRGGSWLNSAGDCRSAYRSWDAPGNRVRLFGFRLACVPGPRAPAMIQS